MPEVRCSRMVPADVARTWDFVKEIDNWAKLIPGYQHHEKLDDRRSRWTVRGEVGVLARTVDLEVAITEWVEETRVGFEITGISEMASGEGSFHLLGVGARIGDGAPSEGGTDAAAEDPASTSWLARLLRRIRRALSRRPADTGPAQVVGDGHTGFEFELGIRAGGMVGPVVNVMLESLIQKVGEEFADEIVAAIEGNAG
jgi:hypothetical protein